MSAAQREAFDDQRGKILARYDGLDARSVCYWLHHAQRFVSELAPEGVEVKTGCHDTATYAYVYLTMEGEEPLLVWYKTNWISAAYEGNDRGKTIGIQPGCEFIRPTLHKFFIAVRDRLRDAELARIDREQAEYESQIQEKHDRLARYRDRYSRQSSE